VCGKLATPDLAEFEYAEKQIFMSTNDENLKRRCLRHSGWQYAGAGMICPKCAEEQERGKKRGKQAKRTT
jgi:hypothetical protein